MSLQMPRRVINEVVFSGFTRPKQIGISDPTHKWYSRRLAEAYLEYDIEKANRLLDAVGVIKKDKDGLRLGPDGEPIRLSLLTIAIPGRDPVSEIISEELPKVGLQVSLRTVGWEGLEDSLRKANWELYLLQDIMGYPHFWPDRMDAMRLSLYNAYRWAQWLETNGAKGVEPSPVMRECWSWWQKARSAANERDLAAAINWLHDKAAEQLFAVGILSFPPQLRVKSSHIGNVSFTQQPFFKAAAYIKENAEAN